MIRLLEGIRFIKNEIRIFAIIASVFACKKNFQNNVLKQYLINDQL